MNDLDVARAERDCDQFAVSPATVLKLALSDIGTGKIKPNRLLVVAIDDQGDGQLVVGTYRAHLPWEKELVVLDLQHARAGHAEHQRPIE